jgi:hypothetical protein
LKVRPVDLAESLQRRASLLRVDRRIAIQLTAPFKDSWSREHHEGRRELERALLDYSSGRPVVSVAKTVARQAEIRALPMSDLQRADFEDGLSICTDLAREQQLLDEAWGDTSVLRARHRRVRNAVNHGLPLDATTLNSIREYADTTSGMALNIALSWFKNREPGTALLQRAERAWVERTDRIGYGRSLSMEDTPDDAQS